MRSHAGFVHSAGGDWWSGITEKLDWWDLVGVILVGLSLLGGYMLLRMHARCGCRPTPTIILPPAPWRAPPRIGSAQPYLKMQAVTAPEQKLLYVNLWGQVGPADGHRFRSFVTPYLESGYVLYRVTISSVGGAAYAAIDIGSQIRALGGQVRAPFHDADGSVHCVFSEARMDKLQHGGDGDADPDGFACLCVSACSNIWTSGLTREGDAVGIHMFRFDARDAARWSPEELRRQTSMAKRELDGFLARMGMPAALRARQWSTPAGTMYYLTSQEIAGMERNTALAPVLVASCKDPNNPFPSWMPVIRSNDPARSICYRKMMLTMMRLGAARYLGRLDS